MEQALINRLSTLSHPQRMGVFRLLIRRYPDQLSAGEISSILGLKPSTASVYLAALKQSGIISQRRNGTHLYYTANLQTARDIVSELFHDCCQGRPDLCPPSLFEHVEGPVSDQKLNVLFICTGNSARSIFAETLLRDIAGERFNVYSAGTAAKSKLNPHAVEVLNSKGHDVSPLRSKNISEFQLETAPKMDFVFTVCDQAANEDCPAWPGQPISGHWGMPDPVLAKGTLAEQRLAFQQTYGALHNRISAFAALPFDKLNKASLQNQIDKIGLKLSDQEY
ncbi:helix-turn-helix domain-containing protein [Parasedimentitalea huanghaiensis]|uniref:Helix-turn-helix domain-containing protein n=1 Tax=Parasedimentitalea huanghaiensis TaxID=2682100 RepID=A0A6L6WFA9_9RHOB|nr:helix-turn-helix domain-containing protein [Zongyanglinia huanghaiensis]MVO14342.1 helix-turn-helix domain-containing protein [Zongyanglinia huanghaiensis]